MDSVTTAQATLQAAAQGTIQEQINKLDNDIQRKTESNSSAILEQLAVLRSEQDQALKAEERRVNAMHEELVQNLEKYRSEKETHIDANKDDVDKLLEEMQQKQKVVGQELDGIAQQVQVLAEKGEQATCVSEQQAKQEEQLSGLKSGLEAMADEQKRLCQEVSNSGSMVNACRESIEEFRQANIHETEEAAQELQQLSEGLQELRELMGQMQDRASGFDEQLGSMVQTAAELLGKVDELAPAKVVDQLRSRVDAGFDALIVRFETEKWMKGNVDAVADSICNSYFHLLEQGLTKLQGRMKECEQQVHALGA